VATPARAVPPPARTPRPPARAAHAFAWPVSGTVISRFGGKADGSRNDGINVAAPRGTPITAAENGVVVYAGNELKGFGNLLLVKHADDWMTAYAHTELLTVKKGDTVRRGQTIGRVGSSGNVTAPQLHFEIRRGSKAVDPLQHLGKQMAGL
jgi:murein DD-endopeptidase MepM/ murein hydrolase activator NlpD